MNEIFNTLKNAQYQHIKTVEEKIQNAIKIKKSLFYDYFETFLFDGAKRLRPLFIFLVSNLEEFEVDEDVYNLAASVELLHSASLIHDDILDDAEIRRNHRVIHIEKSTKEAVLAGDYLLSLSMDFISKIKNNNVFSILANASYKMVESEIYSLSKRFQKIEKDEYFEILKNKTSSLFIASIEALYEIKNKPKNPDILNFTKEFSIIFQLKDDINNFLNCDEKKLSNDSSCGITTLPYILGAKNNKDYAIIGEVKNFLNNKIELTEKILKNYKNNENLILLLNLFRG